MTEPHKIVAWVPMSSRLLAEDAAVSFDFNHYIGQGLRGELWSQRRNRNPFPVIDPFPWLTGPVEFGIRVASTAVDVRDRLRLARRALAGERLFTDPEETP